MSARRTEEWLADYQARQGRKASHASKAAQVAPSEPTVKHQVGREYSFTVFGEPQPAGSKQVFPLLDKKRICKCGPVHGPLPHRRDNGSIIVNVADDNPDTKAWKRQVSKTAREEYSGPLLTGFVSLECVFYLARPKSHYGTGANEHRVKPSAPALPGVKPDHDKLLRAVSDGLTQAGNVYVDDARVVDGIARKRYGNPPRVEITIAEIIVPDPYEQPELFELEDRPAVAEVAVGLVIIADPEHAHLIEVWEPLPTKAPNPNLAQPYCCYANTHWRNGIVLRLRCATA